MLCNTVDSVSTSFDVISPNPPTNSARLLTDQVSTLLKPVSKSAQNWMRGAEPLQPPTHFLYLDQLGYVCSALGCKVSLWKESGYGRAIEYPFETLVTSIGIMHHTRVEHIVIICAGKKLHVVIVQQSLQGEAYFVPIRVFGSDLPTEITTMKCTKLGKALLGGSDGNLYQLKLDLKGTFIEEGFEASIVNLTWEWKKLLTAQVPVREIYIDSERELAYAVHDTCEIEVVSFKETMLSDKPSRVAVYDRADDVQIMSFSVLPTSGFGDAVFLGVSHSGQLYYFSLDRSCMSSNELTAEDIRKRAKTWCGIGLKQNLKIAHTNSAPCTTFRSHVEQGATVEVVAVMQTTMYFSVFDHGTKTSTLWEMKNGHGATQALQVVPSVSVKGKVVGLCPTESLSPRFEGSHSIETRIRANELTMQYFHVAPRLLCFSREQHQSVVLEWPCNVLESIFDEKDVSQLTNFIETYSASETAAMALFLNLKGHAKAKCALLENTELKESLSEGFVKLFKRLTAPIWMTEVFECENTGSIFRPNHVLRVKLPGSALKLFKEAGGRFSKSLRGFLAAARVDVYRNDDVFVRATSSLTHDQAQAIVHFRHLPEGFEQSMALLEYLGGIEDLNITQSKHKDLLREISLMSVRDFVFFTLTRRSELFEFFTAIKAQLNDAEVAKLDDFFKGAAPLLDPLPAPRKEDAFGKSLSTRMKDLRKKIRSLNEHLGKFTEHEIKDKEKRQLLLRDHYGCAFTMIQSLTEEIFQTTDRNKVIEEVLKFVKVLKEVDDDGTRQALLVEIATSPLGHKKIISCDKSFEKALKIAADMTQKHRVFSYLTRDQIKATLSLIGYYEQTFRYEDAGQLNVVLATRKPDSKSETPSVESRQAHFRAAEECFKRAKTGQSVQSLICHLSVQKEAVNILMDRYASYAKDPEDEQLLSFLNTSIVPPSDLKVMMRCWLADGSEETEAAFRKNAKYKSLEALIEAIA